MMRLSLRHIQVFHAVMSFGSVTQAAEYLRTSQPTVSREIKALERALGFKVFEKTGRRLIATPNAIRLHSEVRRAFVGLEEITHRARTIREEATRHFEIACMPLFAQGLMPAAARRFLEEATHCTVALTGVDHAALAAELLKPRYDFALLEVGIQVEGVVMTEIAVGHEVCVLPSNHRLCAKDRLDPEDLDGERAITLLPGDAYRQRYERMLERAGARWKVVVETATADTMCAMARAGVGLAIVNPITARNHQGAGLEVRPLSVSMPFVVAICRPSGRPASDELNRFLEIIVEECRLVG